MPPELLLSWLASALVPYVLQGVKAARRAYTRQPGTFWLHRTVAVLASIATALGVSASFDREAGELVIRGLDAPALVTFAVMAGGNFVVQQVVYRWRLDPRDKP